jgi:hypothetical protein
MSFSASVILDGHTESITRGRGSERLLAGLRDCVGDSKVRR